MLAAGRTARSLGHESGSASPNAPRRQAPFLDSRRLAAQLAQVVQLRPPHLAQPKHFQVVKLGRVVHERALYTDAVTADSTDGVCAIGRGGPVLPDDHALECLQT